jgi:hypothetical protein
VFGGLLIILAGALVGCVAVHHPSYPSTWPALRASGVTECADLAGRYTDSGETFDRRYHPSLGRLLLDVRATQVELSSSASDELWIRGWADDGSAVTKTLVRKSGDFDCAGGDVILRRAEFVNEQGVLARRSRVLHLSKAVDGSLIVRQDEAALGSWGLLIPLATSVTLWHRFPPASAPPAS